MKTLLCLLLSTGLALAEEWKSADLRPMMGPGEGFQSTTLVTAGYAFIWLLVLAFVTSVWLRSRRIDRELRALEESIADPSRVER